MTKQEFWQDKAKGKTKAAACADKPIKREPDLLGSGSFGGS
jgi:hypothetical protein